MAGDLSVRWHSTQDALIWDLEPGDLFAVARWREAGDDYGLMALHHPGVASPEEAFRRAAQRVTDHFHNPEVNRGLEDILSEFCGWGLVVKDRQGLRVFRDPIGRLPLVFRRLGRTSADEADGVVVGTRPAMVLGERRAVRRCRVEGFLRRERLDERDDFFQEVQRIRAGEQMIVDRPGAPRFQSYWPGSLPTYSGSKSPSQAVADTLTAVLKEVGSRGGELVSLSGGYDSTLLLLLGQEAGLEPRSISMVAPETEHFDERRCIEEVLDARGIDGEFFDIRGPQRWGEAGVHHPHADLGPAFMAEAAYFRNFFDAAGEHLEKRGKPPVLITGLGSDQLFFVSSVTWMEDLLWEGRRLPAVSTWRARTKRRIKRAVKRLGLSALPYRLPTRSGPPWLSDSEAKVMQWHPLYDRRAWMRENAEQFRSWSWEYTVRLLERYRREVGVVVELPFLHPEMLRLGLSLPPSVLRQGGKMKAPLRQLLEGRVPQSFFEDRRVGCFDEVVWEGLFNHLRPRPQAILAAQELGEIISLERPKLFDILGAIRRESDLFKRRYSHELWRTMATELWLSEVRKILDAPPSKTQQACT